MGERVEGSRWEFLEFDIPKLFHMVIYQFDPQVLQEEDFGHPEEKTTLCLFCECRMFAHCIYITMPFVVVRFKKSPKVGFLVSGGPANQRGP